MTCYGGGASIFPVTVLSGRTSHLLPFFSSLLLEELDMIDLHLFIIQESLYFTTFLFLAPFDSHITCPRVPVVDLSSLTIVVTVTTTGSSNNQPAPTPTTGIFAGSSNQSASSTTQLSLTLSLHGRTTALGLIRRLHAHQNQLLACLLMISCPPFKTVLPPKRCCSWKMAMSGKNCERYWKGTDPSK